MVLVNNTMLMSNQLKQKKQVQGHTIDVNKFEENVLTYLDEQSKLNVVLKNTCQGQMIFKDVVRFFIRMNLLFCTVFFFNLLIIKSNHVT